MTEIVRQRRQNDADTGATQSQNGPALFGQTTVISTDRDKATHFHDQVACACDRIGRRDGIHRIATPPSETTSQQLDRGLGNQALVPRQIGQSFDLVRLIVGHNQGFRHRFDRLDAREPAHEGGTSGDQRAQIQRHLLRQHIPQIIGVSGAHLVPFQLPDQIAVAGPKRIDILDDGIDIPRRRGRELPGKASQDLPILGQLVARPRELRLQRAAFGLDDCMPMPRLGFLGRRFVRPAPLGIDCEDTTLLDPPRAMRVLLRIRRCLSPVAVLVGFLPFDDRRRDLFLRREVPASRRLPSRDRCRRLAQERQSLPMPDDGLPAAVLHQYRNNQRLVVCGTFSDLRQFAFEDEVAGEEGGAEHQQEHIRRRDGSSDGIVPDLPAGDFLIAPEFDIEIVPKRQQMGIVQRRDRIDVCMGVADEAVELCHGPASFRGSQGRCRWGMTLRPRRSGFKFDVRAGKASV